MCPRCRDDISPLQFFPDRAAQRELQQIPVACPNEGCQWNGYYSNYEGHYIKCDYQPTQCVYSGCGEMVAKGMLKRHAEQCQFRPQQCEWCQENISLRSMKVHKENCPMRPIACPECGTSVPGRLVELHKSEECPNTLRKCVFAVAGCSYEGKGADLVNHEEQCNAEHLRLVLRAQVDIDQRMKEFQQRGVTTSAALPDRMARYDSAITH